MSYYYMLMLCFIVYVIAASGLSSFMVGVSRTYTGTVSRGSYPLCGQYLGLPAAGARLNITCGADTPAGRYVIIQLPIFNFGPLTVCELEVYGKSKLIGTTFHNLE